MSLRKQATSGIAWTFAQQFGNQIIGFIVSLVLARLLLPSEFGLIGMIAVFITIGKSLVDGGLTQSIIRSDSLDQIDFSTVFYFNLVTSIFIYFLVYICAPIIANFYDKSILIDLIRLYGISFIISALTAVQRARLTKNMEFKTLMLISLPSTLLGGVVGLVMAYFGYGVWSLVWSALANSAGTSIQLWYYSKWSPSLVFSKSKFKQHFSFGYKLTISDLLNAVFQNAYVIVIGKFFSASQVGFYTRAETLKQLPVTNISKALNKVTYPLFSSIKNDDERLKRVYKQLMQTVVFVIAPVLTFMAILAEPLIRFLFTEKWLPAVPYFQILCATGILYPIHAYNLNILNVKGRSDLFLKLEVMKKIIIIIAIAVTIKFGIIALLYGQVIVSVLSFIINSYYSGRFINYKTLEQIKDLTPSLILTVVAGGFVFLVNFTTELSDILSLVISTLVGLVIFLSVSYLLKWSELETIFSTLKKTNLNGRKSQ